MVRCETQSRTGYVLLDPTSSGIGILCTTVQRLTRSEKATDELEARMSDYDTNTDESLDVKNSDLILQEQGIYR